MRPYVCRWPKLCSGLGCCQSLPAQSCSKLQASHFTAPSSRLAQRSREHWASLLKRLQSLHLVRPAAGSGGVGLGPRMEKGWDGGFSSDFSGKRGERGGGGRPPREINKTYILQSLPPSPSSELFPAARPPLLAASVVCDSGSLSRGWGAAEEPEPSGTQLHHVPGWGL